MSDKPRNYAVLNLPGFECRCDGITLEARVGDGPWHSVVLPSQDEDAEPSSKSTNEET